jgi:hypothetical protein
VTSPITDKLLTDGLMHLSLERFQLMGIAFSVISGFSLVNFDKSFIFTDDTGIV